MRSNSGRNRLTSQSQLVSHSVGPQIAAAFQDTGSEATLNTGGTDGKQRSQECIDDSSLPLGVTSSSKPTSTQGNATATATQKRDATDASSSNDSSASGSNPKKKRKKRRIKVRTLLWLITQPFWQKPGDRHYVCLLRSDSFTGPPMVKTLGWFRVVQGQASVCRWVCCAVDQTMDRQGYTQANSWSI